MLLYFGLSPELAGLRILRLICVLMTVLGQRARELLQNIPHQLDYRMNHDASMSRIFAAAKLV